MFDFGNHLRMLREKHGISQEELGRRVGRAGSVISNYENNIKIPKPKAGGLSTGQQEILNLIMQEFAK